ncbi:TRAP transporter substrate-binding protein [Oleidesulfovibrio sp.]|uniref:TRAP transporter substrate-binding protein n=1 Tax=Oleidesulfovibrio sp. TaxID=2909707 RepID=UPI003A86EB8C
MKKVLLCLALSIAVIIAAISTANAKTVMKMAIGDPENSEMGVVGKSFKKYVEEQTNGELEVQLFFASALGSETETIHNVRRGTLDFTIAGIANYVPFVKKLGVLTLPYLFDGLTDVVEATNGSAHELLNGYAVKEGGFRILTWTYTDFRYISNSKGPITKLADIKGMKFRVPQSAVLLASYKAWGANPVPISWSETFTALQQGVVDGQCYGYIGFNAMKFAEANQKFITEVHYTYQLQPLSVSERVFRKLSPEYQQIIIDGGKVAQKAVLDYQINESGKAKQLLIDEGVTISSLSDEDQWRTLAISKVWPEMADFVGGQDAINEFLAACNKPAWNPGQQSAKR